MGQRLMDRATRDRLETLLAAKLIQALEATEGAPKASLLKVALDVLTATDGQKIKPQVPLEERTAAAAKATVERLRAKGRELPFPGKPSEEEMRKQVPSWSSHANEGRE